MPSCGAGLVSWDEDVGVAEIVPSEELRALLLRIYLMWEAADVDAFAEVLSMAPSLLIVGRDDEEWLMGADGVNVFAAQVREIPPFTVEPGDVRAYSCGNVGWVSDRPRYLFADGNEERGRLTATFVVEQGHWRVIQWHFSTPSNDAFVSYSLPKSIDRVEHLVRDDRPDVASGSAPDGTVTIVFSDIESSTVLMERLGETEFMRMLAWHDRLVRDSTEEHRGFVVKSEGDGFMFAFPSAAFALRSCLAIRERTARGYGGVPIRLRAGLHAGEALRHDQDFYGRTVVIAARISALALGDEILASHLVHALAQELGTFTFGEPRTVTLKGLAGDFEVYPVLA